MGTQSRERIGDGLKAGRNRASGNNRRRGRWMVLGGDRIWQRKEPERTEGRGKCSGGCGLEMQTGRGREASEVGQCPVITGSE